MKTSHTISFNLKGYDRVMAIHKLKQSINKYGDKSGKKHKLLNNIRRKDIIGNNFINLSINRNKSKEEKSSIKINILNKKILQSLVNYNKMKSNNNKFIIKQELTKNLLDDEKIQNENENEILSSSYDYRIKETDLFSSSNKIFINDNSNSKRNKNKDLPRMNLIKSNLNSTIRKTKTYNNFYKLLNKSLSPINNKNKIIIQEKEQLIKSKLQNSNNEDNITFKNRKFIPKIRNLKLGTKLKKVKLNCKIVKLGRNFSAGNIKLNEENTKTRTLFYKKYKKTKDMKLTKRKKTKSYNNIKEGKTNFFNNKRENIFRNENMKNFGQQTMNEYYINNNRINSFNLLKRIYSYIRLPNINKINFPKESLKSGNNVLGFNFDYNDNYLYLKDIKNQSLNKIYMINPFIRNRIINNLLEKNP